MLPRLYADRELGEQSGAPAGRLRQLPEHVFHFADALNESSIRRTGLLSTKVLVQRQGVGAELKTALVDHRPDNVTLPDGAFVRDQRPMPPAALTACLDHGITPGDWYALVNSHVFFWLDRERVRRHAGALRCRSQWLLTIDARALVAAHGEAAYLTPFNIGYARRTPARRGWRTLVPLATWIERGWSSEAELGARPRSPAHPPAELLVRHGVPQIERFLVDSKLLPSW